LYSMKKILVILIIGFIFSGCVSLQKVSLPEDLSEEAVKVDEESFKDISESPDPSSELQDIKSEELAGYVEKKGVVFAKTDFQGLLETRYVKFLFENLEDSTHTFQLHIGENSDQQTFPWDVKTVKPGYFFVELPVGRYKISSVSIPVGSTMATEEMDVTLEVIPDTVCYVGTLKMVGTKEKIKLGGLPVIKPGFEYTVEVLDEREEGIKVFRQDYPNFLQDISIKLMQVNGTSPGSI
ncbi:MAG: hypothetical protein KAR32_07830, partial [Candidatus Omnitrophica bacterium]|nr:hypothetical protein [Candidatus Omnitrophota bacterium]